MHARLGEWRMWGLLLIQLVHTPALPAWWRSGLEDDSRCPRAAPPDAIDRAHGVPRPDDERRSHGFEHVWHVCTV